VPKTYAGKIVTILLGLPGCACCVLFFNLFLERVVTFIAFVLRWIHGLWQRRRWRTRPEMTADEYNGDNDYDDEEPIEWKPSVYLVLIVLFMITATFASCASAVYHVEETWSYVDTFYYCFVAFSTTGFGDYVSGDLAVYPCDVLYRIGNFAFLILGACIVYSLNNVASIVIKQFLNFVIGKMNFRCGGSSHFNESLGSCCCRRSCFGDGEKVAPSQVVVTPALQPHRARRKNSIHPLSVSDLERQQRQLGHQTLTVSAADPSGSNAGARRGSIRPSDNPRQWQSRRQRRRSVEEVSVREFLRFNKISMAMMQKQLQETATQRSHGRSEAGSSGGSSARHRPTAQHQQQSHRSTVSGDSNGINGGIGPLAILDRKLNSDAL
jgi:potassium channel subfamily K member 13